MEVLNEIYFGKSPALLRIEDYIMKLKTKYARDNMFRDYKAFRSLKTDPIVRKIEDEISNLFGYNATTFTFIPIPQINAYTVPFLFDEAKNIAYDINEKQNSFKDLKNAVIVNNRGFRFDTKKFPVNLLVCITLGCLFGERTLTAGELVGILLHEIGHTFSLPIFGADTNKYRINEKTADNFAAMYGYGPETVKVFQKFTLNYGAIEKYLKDIPVINILVGTEKILGDVFYKLLTSPDEHPEAAYRIRYQAKQLEADLKQTPDMNPKMKAEIQKQIDLCNQYIKEYEENSDNMSDRMIKWYNRNLQSKLPSESRMNSNTEKIASSELINDRILGMYKVTKKR